MWLAGRCETLEEAGMISIQTMPASSRSGIEIMRLTFVKADTLWRLTRVYVVDFWDNLP